jgi:hypothetical protein
MATVHGKDIVAYFDGYDLTTYLNDMNVNRARDTAETSTFGNEAKTYIAGMSDANISFAGLWDAVAGGTDARLAAMFAAANSVVTVGFNGDTLGNSADLAVAIQTSYDIAGSIGDAVAVSGEMQVSGGADSGKWLHAKGAETTAGNYASVDNGAASSNGYSANLHVFAISGTPAAVIKLQGSSDDGAGDAFADIATFATVTAVTAEQKVGTGAVERYLRGRLDSIGGASSVTFALAVARR